MSIQDWAALAEIIGAIAVVGSLVYLAVQIRQNTRELALSVKATELAAFERNVESGNRTREMFILNPEIADLYRRGIKNYAALEGSEKLRFGLVLSNIFSALQGGYVRQLTYGNDPGDFGGSKVTLDQLVRLRGVRDWLSSSNPDWRPEFSALVEERVSLIKDAEEEQVNASTHR